MEVADPARRLDREIAVEEVQGGGELGQVADDARDEGTPADRHALTGELAGKALQAELADPHDASGSASPSSSKRRQTTSRRSLNASPSSSSPLAKYLLRSAILPGQASIRRSTAAEKASRRWVCPDARLNTMTSTWSQDCQSSEAPLGTRQISPARSPKGAVDALSGKGICSGRRLHSGCRSRLATRAGRAVIACYQAARGGA